MDKQMLRLFIACKLERNILEKAIEIQNELKKLNADIKWVEPENMHLTLKFLGAMNEISLEAVFAQLQAVARKHICFDLTVESMGAFPRAQNPRVIWLGASCGTDKLTLLAQDIEESLKSFNMPVDEKEFSSHLTLGRMRTPKNKERLADVLEKNNNILIGTMEIKYFTLFQSQLTKQGPVYTDLNTFMLKPR